MIRKVHSHSKVTEVSDVADLSLTAYQGSGITTDPHLINIFGELDSQSTTMTGALKQMKAQSQMETVDLALDNSLRGLFFGTQGALYSTDSAIRTAAEKVDAVLETYGMSMLNESYATESALVKSMLNELGKNKLQDAVLAIPGVSAAIAQVQAALDAFNEANATFKQEKSVEGNEKSATEIKGDMLTLMNGKLVRYLDGMWAVDEAGYGALARNIAQIIDDNNVNVKKRSNNPGDDESTEGQVNE